VNSQDIEAARVDVRFARAAYYYIFDTGTGQSEIVQNPAAYARGGAGIQAAEFLIQKGVGVVIAPAIGGNAERVIREANIKAYASEDIRPRELIEKWKKNELKEMF